MIKDRNSRELKQKRLRRDGKNTQIYERKVLMTQITMTV